MKVHTTSHQFPLWFQMCYFNSVLLFSDYLFKLLLIGDSGVGKSCLLLRFAVRMLKTWTDVQQNVGFRALTLLLLSLGRHLHRQLHLYHRSWLQDQDHRHGREDCEVADSMNLFKRNKVVFESSTCDSLSSSSAVFTALFKICTQH